MGKSKCYICGESQHLYNCHHCESATCKEHVDETYLCPLCQAARRNEAKKCIKEMEEEEAIISIERAAKEAMRAGYRAGIVDSIAVVLSAQPWIKQVDLARLIREKGAIR